MKDAFGAKAQFGLMKRPDGKVMHAKMKIGDSVVMISDSNERAKAINSMLYVYVPNVDAEGRLQIGDGAAGSVLRRPHRRPDRSGRQPLTHRDPYRGRVPAEMEKRAANFMKRQHKAA